MEAVFHHSETIDYSKVELVKGLKKSKPLLWTSFILFGWSYGSLGKLGFQAVWYGILLFTFYNLWYTMENEIFDEYSAMAIMGAVVMLGWYIVRFFTLNRDIKKFNSNLADHFYLNPEERAEAGIE